MRTTSSASEVQWDGAELPSMTITVGALLAAVTSIKAASPWLKSVRTSPGSTCLGQSSGIPRAVSRASATDFSVETTTSTESAAKFDERRCWENSRCPCEPSFFRQADSAITCCAKPSEVLIICCAGSSQFPSRCNRRSSITLNAARVRWMLKKSIKESSRSEFERSSQSSDDL